MQQGANPDEPVQAVRTVNKNQPPSSIPPPTPDDIFYVDCHADPDSNRLVFLWEDILHAFQDVVQVRHNARLLPFVKGPDFRTLEPRRIAAIPNAVLDIVLGDPLIAMDTTLSRVAPQEPLSPTSKRREEEELEKGSIFSQDASTTSASRRNPAYGPENEAMDNYRNNDNPAFSPTPRAPHFILGTNSLSIDSTSDSTKGAKDLSQMLLDANLGNNEAQVALGDIYRNGEGVDQDYQEAMMWYLKAAAQGNADAQKNIGLLHDKGWGVPQDFSQAADWYLKAAEQGHVVAQNNIGSMCEEGEGVPQDYSRAMDWYLKSAEQGNAKAQRNIAHLYQRGRGVPQDYSQAMQWNLKAAEQGHLSAQYNIGRLYHEGQGVPRDYVQAMTWYLKAAKQGYSDSQYVIGRMYAAGHGAPQDYSQAAEWYLKAAEQGRSNAQCDLGELFENGKGVTKDNAKAKEWYQKAADRGLARAKVSLEALKKKESPIYIPQPMEKSTKKQGIFRKLFN